MEVIGFAVIGAILVACIPLAFVIAFCIVRVAEWWFDK